MTTFSIWENTAGGMDGLDSDPYTLGVKFRSDIGGYVVGVRFYKHASSTGTHVGGLWSSDGTLLTSKSFSGETSDGWQEQLFDSAVAIVSATTYVIGCLFPNGRYAVTGTYFAFSSYTNGHLTALQSGIDGNNGVFTAGSSLSFPSSSFNNSNYWVDVLFADTVNSIPVLVNSYRLRRN